MSCTKEVKTTTLKFNIMKRYFNIQTNGVVETIDEVNANDFATRKEFVQELRRLKREYNIAGMAVYTSQRCTNDWKNRN